MSGLDLAAPPRGIAALRGLPVLVALALAVVVAGLWHLTQGTSGLRATDIVEAVLGGPTTVDGIDAGAVFGGSRLPRLAAAVAVGIALGVAGALLQSVTRNPLASPDTLAVTAGAYVALVTVAAARVSMPAWASSAVAFGGALAAAALVLGLAGRAGASTRLILAGSAVAMALEAVAGIMLLVFRQSTTGLYAWGSGSLAQLSLDASSRAAPLIGLGVLVALLLARRLDVLSLGDDAAATLGVPVRSTSIAAVVCAVLLSSVAVTVAGPIAFVGLGAPVIARGLARWLPSMRRSIIRLPAAGLLGALLIVLADATIRAVLGARAATAVPTGIPTAFIGGLLIVGVALRMRRSDLGSLRDGVASTLRTRRRFVTVLSCLAVGLAGSTVVAILAGSIWLQLGDVALWIDRSAPEVVARALDDRSTRIAAAVVAGAALGVAGAAAQGTLRNPLADPGILGITAGAGLGAVVVVTALGGGRTALVGAAILGSLMSFALLMLLSARGGVQPDRVVLIGIGMAFSLVAVSTYLLLQSSPWQTPRILTWLSGTTYGRVPSDVIPALVALVIVVPVLLGVRRQLDLVAIDDDIATVRGVPTSRTRLVVLALAAIAAGAAVVAIGTIGFVGLIAPHLARALVGSAHRRVIPTAALLGAVLVLVADTVARTVLAPQQLPAGLVLALLGAPYFIWLLRRTGVGLR